jgi:hypothetical protein
MAWNSNINDIHIYHWKNVLVMTHIESLSYDTYRFKKYDGSYVTKAPQNYTRIL